MSRLTSSKRRELLRLQASQPTLPAGFDAAREVQARAAASAASARPAAPAPQPKAAAQHPAAPAQAAAPRGRAAGRDHAQLDQAQLDHHLAKAAAASHPAHDHLAPPTDLDRAHIVPDAHTRLAEVTPPAPDTGARLQAEIAARAATTTKLAA